MANIIDSANAEAVGRIVEARPVLTGLGKALDLIPGMQENLLLHAGPPIAWEQASGPLRGALIGALIFEAKAGDEAEAERLIVRRGKVELAPCHHHSAVRSRWRASSRPRWPCMRSRTGRTGTGPTRISTKDTARFCATALTAKRCRKDCVGCTTLWHLCLGRRLSLVQAWTFEPCWPRRCIWVTRATIAIRRGSVLYTLQLAPHIAKAAPDAGTAADVIGALGDNALSVLNPVMAACKAMADAGCDVEQSTIVTTMARNGTEFGIRVSGLGGRWFTAPCPQPVGLYFPGFSAEDGNPDIGDSTITETAGIGAFAMAAAPAIVTFRERDAAGRAQRHSGDVRNYGSRA